MKWKEIIEFKEKLVKRIEEQIVVEKNTLTNDYDMEPDDIQSDEYPDYMDEEDKYCANFVLGKYEKLRDILKIIENGL